MKIRLAIQVAILCAMCGCRVASDSLLGGSASPAMPSTSTQLEDTQGDYFNVIADEAPEDAAPTIKKVDFQQSTRREFSGQREAAYQQPSQPAQPESPMENIPAPPPSEFSLSDLTLVDFEGIALGRNPAIAQAAAQVDAARGRWLQTGLLPNPVVGYSGQQLGSGGRAEQQGIYLGQEIITAKKLRLSRETAAWEVARAERSLESFRLRVLTDVRIGFYDVLIAQRRRDVASQLVEISQRAVEAAKALFQVEEVSEADPLRAQIEADQARIVLQNAENEYLQAWRRLTAVAGIPELAPARLEGDLNPGAIDISWDNSLLRILTESPELAAATADVEAARWAVERAYAEAIPNVEVQAIIQDDRGVGGNNGNLQVSMPIPIWNRNQGGIRRARADAAAAAQAVDRLTLDLQSRLAVAFRRYDSARNQVDKYSREDGILDTAEKTLRLVRAGYEAEEFGLLDLISAQRTYFQTNLMYLDSLRELWASIMEIEGLLLTDSLPK